MRHILDLLHGLSLHNILSKLFIHASFILTLLMWMMSSFARAQGRISNLKFVMVCCRYYLHGFHTRRRNIFITHHKVFPFKLSPSRDIRMDGLILFLLVNKGVLVYKVVSELVPRLWFTNVQWRMRKRSWVKLSQILQFIPHHARFEAAILWDAFFVNEWSETVTTLSYSSPIKEGF